MAAIPPFLASADWMPRNFFRRIEIMFPVEDPRLKSRIIEEILPLVVADTAKARSLQPDGSYIRVRPPDDKPPVRSQLALQNLARDAARDGNEAAHKFVPIMRRTPVPTSEVVE